MSNLGSDEISPQPNVHDDTNMSAIQDHQGSDATAPAPVELTGTESSSISYDESDEETPGPHYAPIQTRASHGHDPYREEELQRTISQIYGGIDEEQRETLRQIASLRRSKTGSSERPGLERADTLAGVSDDDPRLDPERPEFDVYVWSKALIRAMDEDQIRLARAGFAFRDLNVSGSGAALRLQQDFSSAIMAPFRLREYFSTGKKPHKKILRNFDGIVKSGEMLIVLGRPGSGCSTFLKTICGELAGLELDKGSTVHYNGIQQADMIKEFKGETVYNQEVDKHFPHLTVGETLEFAGMWSLICFLFRYKGTDLDLSPNQAYPPTQHSPTHRMLI